MIAGDGNSCLLVRITLEQKWLVITTSDEETPAVETIPGDAVVTEVRHGICIGIDHDADSKTLAPQERVIAAGFRDHGAFCHDVPAAGDARAFARYTRGDKHKGKHEISCSCGDA